MKINKKQIGLIAGLVCAILLIVLLLTMCNGSGNGDHQGDPTDPIPSVENTTEATEESAEPSEEATEDTEATEESTEATEDATEESTQPTTGSTGGNTRPGGSSGYNPDYGDDDEDDSSGPVAETAPAAGSEGSPYVESISGFPESFPSVLIPADSSIFHHVYGADGGVLTIEDAEAYVIYNGTTYEPDEYGIVSVPFVTVEPENEEDISAQAEPDGDTDTGTDTDTGADEVPLVLPQSFQVGSKSAEARSFILSFNAPLGSLENPAVLEAVDGVISIEAALEAGDEDGYHYSFTSPNGGILTLQVDSITENVGCDIIVTAGESVVKLSECEEGILSVNLPLDEAVIIQVIAVPGEDGTYPAAEIKILGQVEDTSGTKENPIVFGGEFPIVTDVLEPGTEVYYSVYGASNMILSIADENAYVIIGDETWTAVEGIVTGEVVAANPREAVLIGIGNGGDTAESYTVNFDYKPGSMMNPAPLMTGEPNTAVIGAGNVDGFWYTWTAQEEGTLTLTMPDGNWMYLINNVTSSVYGETQYSDAEDASSLAVVDVAAGDELSIMVSTYDPADPFNIPAGEVVFEATFTPPEGTKDNPMWLVEDVTVVQVKPGTSLYCNAVMSGVSLQVSGEGSFAVNCAGVNYAVVNGVATIPVVSGSTYEPVPLVITNSGTETAEYSITVIYPVGSRENPELIELMGQYTASVSADGDTYFYTWIAPSDGQFTVSMVGDDWIFAVNNITTFYYGDIHSSQDGSEPSESLDVMTGDELQISVSTASGKAKAVVLEVDFLDPTLGTEENPLGLIDMENVVTVRPGATMYTNVVKSGTDMTVTGPETFTLTYDGKTYSSVNGVVTIPRVAGSYRAPVQMMLMNPGTEKVTYTISFTYPLGSSMNPEEIREMGEYTASVIGDGEGYFFTWKSDIDGVFTITMKGDDWSYTLNNLTTPHYGDNHDSRADGVVSETVEVKVDDEIQINIGTSSRQNKDVTVEFDAYDPTLGTEESPIWLSGMENTISVRPGTTVYCNVIRGGVDMTVTVDGDLAITYGGVGQPVVNGAIAIDNLQATPNTPIPLVFTNSGEEKVECKIRFAFPTGTMDNPEIITEMGEHTAEVIGNSQGYFYTWFAEGDGQFTITMLGDDWVYVMNNLTSYAYGGFNDSNGSKVSETISVKTGDEIQINIGTYSRTDKAVPLAFSFQKAEDTKAVPQNTEFEGSYTPKTFEVTADEIQEMGLVDLTQINELWASKAGIYHLDSKSGPLVLLDFTDDTYVNLAELVDTRELTIEITDENGEISTLSCNELLKQYMECAWVVEISEDVTRSLYPLTEDLELILKSLGEQLGWFDPDSDGYLFRLDVEAEPDEAAVELEQDSLWMFSCHYIQFVMDEPVTENEPEQVQESVPEDVIPEGSAETPSEAAEPEMA